ncbi:MAG: hypothetical protein ACFE8M_06565 [Candidatus Hermodarchaeota archaeon]
MKITKQQLKYFCLIVIALNLVSVILGIFYYALSTTAFFWLWNIQGIIMFISWILNLLLVYINDRILMKSEIMGRKMNLLSYGFLAFIIFAMFFFTTHSIITSFIDPPMLISYILALLALIGIAIFGILLAYLDIKNLERRGVLKVE